MHHRTGTTKSASTSKSSEEKEPVPEEQPSTRVVPAYPVKRRGESAKLGERKTIEPETTEPQALEP